MHALFAEQRAAKLYDTNRAESEREQAREKNRSVSATTFFFFFENIFPCAAFFFFLSLSPFLLFLLLSLCFLSVLPGCLARPFLPFSQSLHLSMREVTCFFLFCCLVCRVRQPLPMVSSLLSRFSSCSFFFLSRSVRLSRSIYTRSISSSVSLCIDGRSRTAAVGERALVYPLRRHHLPTTSTQSTSCVMTLFLSARAAFAGGGQGGTCTLAHCHGCSHAYTSCRRHAFSLFVSFFRSVCLGPQL